MKRILVGIKRVVDANVRIRVKPDGSGVSTDGVKMAINPFDEIALEEALRIKERGAAEEVIVATVGPADSQQQLRTALAMGADRALHVQADGVIEPLTVARALLKLIEREQPFLVILGKQAIDDDNGQTGQVLAEIEKAFGKKLPANAILKCPTVTKLAKSLAEEHDASGASPLCTRVRSVRMSAAVW